MQPDKNVQRVLAIMLRKTRGVGYGMESMEDGGVLARVHLPGLGSGGFEIRGLILNEMSDRELEQLVIMRLRNMWDQIAYDRYIVAELT